MQQQVEEPQASTLDFATDNDELELLALLGEGLELEQKLQGLIGKL